MIDFPMTDLLDDNTCTIWLEPHLHPDGVKCPHCGSTTRRLFRDQGHFPAYRCRVCQGYDTLLMLAHAHYTLHLYHQQFNLPPAQIHAHDLPRGHRPGQIGH